MFPSRFYRSDFGFGSGFGFGDGFGPMSYDEYDRFGSSYYGNYRRYGDNMMMMNDWDCYPMSYGDGMMMRYDDFENNFYRSDYRDFFC